MIVNNAKTVSEWEMREELTKMVKDDEKIIQKS